jgi:uncharacterized damage-inducible protein DinB
MTTTTRAAEYAVRFRSVNDDVIATVTGCTNEQWQQPSAGEGWTIAAVAHHIAEVNGAFAGIVRRLAEGNSYTPNVSMDEIHENNAKHAREFAAADRQATIDLLHTNGSAILDALGLVADDSWERTAGVFGGNELTVAQVFEYVVIGHTAEHLASIKATLGD